ncbi:MAG: iron-sulfur cluster assembly accessory protein [Candidatus Taylorbacteria bacterium]|nr:iron-sulfur cluster assembly accessory protein [Candidatus Taylorbacteria bacterium]
MITITEKVRDYLNYLLNESGIESNDRGIRIGVKAGGCSGLEYYVTPVAKRDKYDKIMVLLGVMIFVDRKSITILTGTTIDYNTNLLDKNRLIFNNPNAKTSCGCGVSFELNSAPEKK